MGRQMGRRHEDFQAAEIVPEMGSHVTSNDVVTWLQAIEWCHCVTLVYPSPRTFEAHQVAVIAVCLARPRIGA